MQRHTDFACGTCGWSGTHPCVVGKIGSRTWLKQIPLKQWHAARRNELQKRKREVLNNQGV